MHDFLTYAKSLEDTSNQAEVVEKQQIEESTAINVVEKHQKCTGSRHGRNYSGKHLSFKGKGNHSASQNKTCFRCGGKYPHEKACPAESKTCNKCHKKGHFAKCCRSKSEPSPQNWRKYNSNHRPLNTVITDSSNTTSDNDSDEYLFAIEQLYSEEISTVNSVEKPLAQFEVKAKLEKTPVKFLIDSGAAVNIINFKTFQEINKNTDSVLCLRKTNVKLLTYGAVNESLTIKGVTTMIIETKKKFLTTDFYVVDTQHKNLLSGETALKLNLITLNCVNKFNTHNKEIKTPNDKHKERTKELPERIKPLVESYKDSLFPGKIGKFKNYTVKLHINQNIPPNAERERRIPFAVRDKVKRELVKLEKQGIIEAVSSEPTPWLSPLVVVPKGNKDIRLCLDMRKANTAIERTRYPTPTVDDLIVKFRGAKRFTKLDIKSAFHQLELSEESRYITAFRSEDRVKRYRRLIFGANSVADIK